MSSFVSVWLAIIATGLLAGHHSNEKALLLKSAELNGFKAREKALLGLTDSRRIGSSKAFRRDSNKRNAESSGAVNLLKKKTSLTIVFAREATVRT